MTGWDVEVVEDAQGRTGLCFGYAPWDEEVRAAFEGGDVKALIDGTKMVDERGLLDDFIALGDDNLPEQDFRRRLVDFAREHADRLDSVPTACHGPTAPRIRRSGPSSGSRRARLSMTAANPTSARNWQWSR